MEGDAEATKIMEYMRANWPSEVKEEWRVTDEMYPKMVEEIVRDWTKDATRKKNFFRIAGQSGSGKTTQLLPATRAWFLKRKLQPVLVAARKFVGYHPFVREIEQEYGVENLRKKTDEVSTILMFLTLKELTARGYDIVLDVTLLDPLVEKTLMGMLEASNYESRMSFVAVSRKISDGFIQKRKDKGHRSSEKGRVVAKKTAEEFWRATSEALRFYIEKYPEMRILIWNAWDKTPVFDGLSGDEGLSGIIEKYWGIDKVPVDVDEDELREAKIEYMKRWA